MPENITVAAAFGAKKASDIVIAREVVTSCCQVDGGGISDGGEMKACAGKLDVATITSVIAAAAAVAAHATPVHGVSAVLGHRKIICHPGEAGRGRIRHNITLRCVYMAQKGAALATRKRAPRKAQNWVKLIERLMTEESRCRGLEHGGKLTRMAEYEKSIALWIRRL